MLDAYDMMAIMNIVMFLLASKEARLAIYAKILTMTVSYKSAFNGQNSKAVCPTTILEMKYLNY